MLFGDVLKKIRKEKGITQRELANEMKVSPSAIGLYEQNRREPEYEVLCKFADFFGADLDYLLGRSLHNNKETSEFRNAKDACIYILKSKAVQKYANYNANNLSDKELDDFAQDLCWMLKTLSFKHKK